MGNPSSRSRRRRAVPQDSLGLEQARTSAYRAVNFAMVQAYWQVGRLIVEHEQGNRKRAAYGEAVLDDVSQRLTADFGNGFTTTNLKYLRSFYLAFRIRRALRDESAATEKANAPRAESAIRHLARDELPVPRPELSWTHYRLLLSVEDATAGEWYMQEAPSHPPRGQRRRIHRSFAEIRSIEARS